MLAAAVSFPELVLAVHIVAVVAGFGALFAYPIFFSASARLEPGVMPWFFKVMQLISRRLINPGLLIVLIAGIYLASKEHQFHAFYVQWGIFAVVVLGGIDGGFVAPRLRKLITISERDLAAVGAVTEPGGKFSFSPDYAVAFRQVSVGGAIQSLIVVVTIFLMATHAGA